MGCFIWLFLYTVPAEVMFEYTSYYVAEGNRELEVCVKVTFSSRSTQKLMLLSPYLKMWSKLERQVVRMTEI